MAWRKARNNNNNNDDINKTVNVKIMSLTFYRKRLQVHDHYTSLIRAREFIFKTTPRRKGDITTKLIFYCQNSPKLSFEFKKHKAMVQLHMSINTTMMKLQGQRFPNRLNTWKAKHGYSPTSCHHDRWRILPLFQGRYLFGAGAYSSKYSDRSVYVTQVGQYNSTWI